MEKEKKRKILRYLPDYLVMMIAVGYFVKGNPFNAMALSLFVILDIVLADRLS